MVTSTGALLVLLVRPILRIARNAATIQQIDSHLHALSDTVSRSSSTLPTLLDEKLGMLSDVAVREYEQDKDTDIISDFIKQNNLVWSCTYLGIDIPTLTRSLLDLATKNPDHELYIHPKVLPQLAGADLSSAKIFVTDCPREACVFLGGRSPNKRKGKLGLIVRSEDRGKTFWAAALNPNSHYVTYLEKTYRLHYQGKPSVTLDHAAKARFLSKLYSVRAAENEDIFEGFLAFPIWQKEYEFAAEALQGAKSVKAVDFMPPSAWDPDPLVEEDPMVKYIDAQMEMAANVRERIHVFSSTLLGVPDSSYSRLWYEKYIALHEQMKFRLSFIADKHVNFKGGFLIVDDNMVFYETKTQFGATTKKENCASFRQEDIQLYSNKFAKLQHHRELLQSPEQLLKTVDAATPVATANRVL